MTVLKIDALPRPAMAASGAKLDGYLNEAERGPGCHQELLGDSIYSGRRQQRIAVQHQRSVDLLSRETLASGTRRKGCHAMTDDREPCLWNAADVAAFLKCSKSFVYKAVEAGQLQVLRIGAMIRFDPEQVRKFAGLSR